MTTSTSDQDDTSNNHAGGVLSESKSTMSGKHGVESDMKSSEDGGIVDVTATNPIAADPDETTKSSSTTDASKSKAKSNELLQDSTAGGSSSFVPMAGRTDEDEARVPANSLLSSLEQESKTEAPTSETITPITDHIDYTTTVSSSTQPPPPSASSGAEKSLQVQPTADTRTAPKQQEDGHSTAKLDEKVAGMSTESPIDVTEEMGLSPSTDTVAMTTKANESAPPADETEVLPDASKAESKSSPSTQSPTSEDKEAKENDATNKESNVKLFFDDTKLHRAVRQRNATLEEIRIIVEDQGDRGRTQLTKYAPQHGGKTPDMLNMIPLHLAVIPSSSNTKPSQYSSGGSGQSTLEIIQYLVEQDPQSLVKPAITLGSNVRRAFSTNNITSTTTTYLPIHMACQAYTKKVGWQSYRIDCLPSYDVVKYLINCNPKTVAMKDKTFGQLPLHVACGGVFGGGPNDRHTSHMLIPRRTLNTTAGCHIIRLLIEQYPKSVSVQDKVRGYTPLHYVLESDSNQDIVTLELLTLLATPDSLKRFDHYGRLPIHVACQNLGALSTSEVHGSVYDKMSLLVELFPSAISIREKDYRKAHKTPMELVLHSKKYRPVANIDYEELLDLLSSTATGEVAASTGKRESAVSATSSQSTKSIGGARKGGKGANVTDLRNQWGEDGKKTDMELHHALRSGKPSYIIQGIIDEDPKRLKKFDATKVHNSRVGHQDK